MNRLEEVNWTTKTKNKDSLGIPRKALLGAMMITVAAILFGTASPPSSSFQSSLEEVSDDVDVSDADVVNEDLGSEPDIGDNNNSMNGDSGSGSDLGDNSLIVSLEGEIGDNPE